MAVQRLKSIRKWLFRASLAGVLVILGLFAWLTAMGAPMSDASADCIVVPGAAIRPGRVPSDALRYRLEGALRLYRAGRAPLIIVSGGGEGDYAEAVVMAEWLEREGVPSQAILKETQARTTRENAANVATIMHQRGMRTALVSSQWFHVARARVALEQEGITTHPAPCGGNTLVKEPLFVAKELAALPAYALKLDQLR